VRGSQLSYRRRRRLVVVTALAAVSGGVALLVAFGPNRNPPPQHFTKTPVQVPVTEKSVPPPPGWRSLARRFVATAVARRDLASAWKIVGPELRGGLTYKEWLTGNIPVIPYPFTSLRGVYLKLDYSYADDVLVEVWFPPPPKAQSNEAESFYLHLRRLGAAGHRRWVVDGWVARH
jgi:hypothetical protein